MKNEVNWKTYSELAPKVESLVLIIKPELKGRVELFNEVGRVVREVINKDIRL